MTAVTLEDAKDHLDETVERAQAGPILLEQAGRPVAVVLSVEKYRELADSETKDLAELAAFWDREVGEMVDDPEAIPLTAELRRELLAGSRHEMSPNSLAVPPGWQPRNRG